MTTTVESATTTRPPGPLYPALKRAARTTGWWYLALGISGMLGFLLLRPQLHVAGDPAATLANLVGRPGLARIAVVMEVGVVATQALAAVWFFKLFRHWNPVAASAVAAFGLMNAVAIMVSAASMATAMAVAGDAGLAPGGDAAGTVQLLFELSTACWLAGGLFFGLWLIPMGHVVVTSGAMPLWLGRILIAGGAGYVLSTFTQVGLADPPGWLAEVLVVPATVGELWMIGYLLVRGVRPSGHDG
jgi:hypothetical protein